MSIPIHADRHPRSTSARARLRRTGLALAATLLAGVAIFAGSKAIAADAAAAPSTATAATAACIAAPTHDASAADAATP